MKWRMERQKIKLMKVVERINKIDKPIARWTKGKERDFKFLKSETKVRLLSIL